MNLMDFFDPNKTIERKPIIAGGRVNTHLEKEVDTRPAPEDNRSYAAKFQEHELLTMRHVKDEESFMDADEDGDGEGTELEVGAGQNDEIYKKFDFTRKITPRLPIAAYRNEILETLEKNSVVVIEGATGCGKTTQVPQYIMEKAFATKKYFNIIVTQPRRLAAMTVAKRVAQERQWELGEVVGYKIGRKREISDDTRITFCTTGVLLEKLVKKQNLDEFTHIILDEVHERDIDMDFLLIVIRKLFYRTRSPVKVIMMSATIKSEKFSSYFSIDDEIPIINLTQAMSFAVKEYYLEDIKRINYPLEILRTFSDKPEITPDMYNLAGRLVFALDQIEKKPIDREEAGASASVTGRSVLIFLPGINEINQMHRELDKLSEQAQGFKYELIPLHSSLTHEEQQKVFKNYPSSTRKIILSTNIAESSITVPDVRYVIDFCLTKSMCVDSTTNFSTLKLEWASLDNCRQRAGRAGRVMDGRVYRLVTKTFYMENLPKRITPEMQRVSLETVVLKSKLIEMGAPETVLGLAMDPPLKSDVYNAILVLKELGGLLNTVNGEYVINDGDMTYLGIIMAHLPVDIRISRLIMLGYAFSVVDEAIIIGAGLSVQGVFSETYNHEMRTYATRLAWANGSGSDLIALLNVYKVYTERIKQNQNRYEAMWADRCGIQIRMIREVVELVQELTYRLSYYNIQSVPMPYGVSMNDYERCIILKVVFAGAFYPNYMAYGNTDMDKERDTFRLTNGRDPSNTVVLAGLQQQHIGKLYKKTIREMFSSFVERSTKIDVNFDHSERVFVTFHPSRSAVDSQKAGNLTDLTDVNMDDNVSGNVLLEVYKAIKYGQVKRRHRLNVLNAGKAEQYAIDKGAAEMILGEFHWKRREEMRRDYVVYPRKNHIEGTLTHFVHLHKFYVQPDEEMPYEEHIRMMLNTEMNLETITKDDLKVGMMVAAKRKFSHNHQYYCRARVVNKNSADPVNVEVYFIDFGNTDDVMVKNVRRIRSGIYANECPLEQLPPRLLECRLACVAPTAISSVRGRWTMETVKKFTDKLKTPVTVSIEVYAFVDGVAYVILHHERENMNEYAISTKLAQYTDENYMVKFDHDRRANCEILNQEYVLDEAQIDYMVNPEDVEVAPPSEAIIDKEIFLHGPNSPLSANLYGLTKASSRRVCKIDRNSVNCVLLDSGFQDYHQKMVVATHIKKTTIGDLHLYATTIMPNIPGILPLLALIFCPTAEFTRNADCSRFISVLTGLGTRPGSKIPTYEEHDMQIPLDVKIDHDDVECINQLRYSISSILLLRTGQEVPELENKVRYKLLHKIKELTLNILTRSRPLCERKYPPKPFTWNLCDAKPTDVLELKDLYGGASVFPFLTSLKLDDAANKEETDRLKKCCNDLYNITVINRISKGGTKCLLCDTYLTDVLQVRLHLFTKLHKDRENEIGYEPPMKH